MNKIGLNPEGEIPYFGVAFHPTGLSDPGTFFNYIHISVGPRLVVLHRQRQQAYQGQD